jgi:hypothetical protein
VKPDDCDILTEVVDHRLDRPAFSDRGDPVVVPTPKPASPPRRRASKAEPFSDEELMAEAGVEPIFSTSEAAEFFDRSNQWLYWGLREGVFTYANGTPIDPDRIGHPVRGRRRFTIPILKEIMKSSYRRGNLDSEQVKTIMRRIMMASMGVEWREREGWRHAHLGRNRYRWHKPSETMWDAKHQEWRLKPDVKPRRDD